MTERARERCEECGGYGVLLDWSKDPGPQGSTHKRLRCGRPSCGREWTMTVLGPCGCGECRPAAEVAHG